MNKLDEICEKFQLLDDEFKLEMLLDYAERLPALPEKYKNVKNKIQYRIAECQTPVYIWVSLRGGRVHIDADVAPEAPTVKGFVSILVHAFEGVTPEDVKASPNDILHRLGLVPILGMTRMHGLTSTLYRIRNEVEKASLVEQAKKKRRWQGRKRYNQKQQKKSQAL